MTLKPWITFVVAVSTLSLCGVALAQTPQPQTAKPAQPVERGTGVSMTNPATPEGKPITTYSQPVVDRWVGTGMTNPVSPDGKPLTTSTSFGQR